MNRALSLLHDISRQPWAIEAGALQRLIARVTAGDPAQLAAFEASAQAADAARAATTAAKPGKGVAVIQISGPIVYRWGRMAYWFGCTNADDILRAVSDAGGDDAVGTVVLYMNSPGGTCWGVPELADAIFALREKKRVIAVADPLSASACYWIGSQAHEFIVVPSGDVGSIGVFMLHLDYSKMLEDAGIKATFIYSAEYKVEGNPLEPLSEEAKARFQQECDAIYAQFLAAVARGRGVGVAEAKEKFGKGRCFQAKEAKAAGMVDRIGTYPALLTKLGVHVAKPEQAARSRAGIVMEQRADGLYVVEAREEVIIAAEIISGPTAGITIDGDRVTIAAKNMTVVYERVALDEDDNWHCRLVSTVHHTDSAAQDAGDEQSETDLVSQAESAAALSRAAARAREIALAEI